jgi:hypothetical protein
VFKASLGVAIKSAQPLASHTAIDAVIGASVAWIDEQASGLGHWDSLLDASELGKTFNTNLSTPANFAA